MLNPVDLIRISFQNPKNQYFLIDGRVYILREEYDDEFFFVLFDIVDIKYVPKFGDILSYDDLDACEEVIYLPNKELVLYYFFRSVK